MIDRFQRTSIVDGKYIIEEVKQFTFNILPLTGNAIVTHVGGNGRFKFKLNNQEYQTTFDRNICSGIENYGLNKDTDQYYTYENIVFDINIREEWRKLYIGHESKEYWKPV